MIRNHKKPLTRTRGQARRNLPWSSTVPSSARPPIHYQRQRGRPAAIASASPPRGKVPRPKIISSPAHSGTNETITKKLCQNHSRHHSAMKRSIPEQLYPHPAHIPAIPVLSEQNYRYADNADAAQCKIPIYRLPAALKYYAPCQRVYNGGKFRDRDCSN